MSYYSELKKIHERWIANLGTSNGQLEDSQTILALLSDIGHFEELRSKWDNACKGHLERRIEVLEENIKLNNQIKELEKNFELSAYAHSNEINKCVESIKFSDQSFREMEELFKSENKRVKELEEACANWQKTWDDFIPMNAAKNHKVFKLEEENANLREALEKIQRALSDSWETTTGRAVVTTIVKEVLCTQQDWKETACENITEALKLGEQIDGDDK